MKKYMHGEFSIDKLNAIEKDLNKIYVKYKKLSVVTPLTIAFAVIVFGINNAFALRYVYFLTEYIDYSNFFLFSELQKFVDGFYFQGDDNFKFLIAIVVFLAMIIVSLVASILFITISNLIKNIIAAIKPIKPLPDDDVVEKIKSLIERAKSVNFYEGGLINGRHSTIKEFGLALLANLISIAVLICFGLSAVSDAPAEAAAVFFGGTAFVILFIVTPIPFLLYNTCGIVGCNQKFGNYRKKVYPITNILDKWWVETDPVEKTRREKAAEKSSSSSSSIYTPTFYPTQKPTTTSDGGLYGSPGCGEIHIDTSGM